MIQSANISFYFYRSKEAPGKFRGNFRRKFPKWQKFPEEISPENFPEIPGVFFDQRQWYRAVISLFIFVKARKIGENSGRNFRRISQIPKIRENFLRKFPEISRKFPKNRGVFLGKTQWYKAKIMFLSGKNRGKSGKFPENSRKFREIFPGKCQGYFKNPLCSEV